MVYTEDKQAKLNEITKMDWFFLIRWIDWLEDQTNKCTLSERPNPGHFHTHLKTKFVAPLTRSG